ncbi:MAG: glycosyltransferase family 4 protein [Patescibacteria group bacterium]
MKLLVIGSDRNLFKKNSDTWNRYLDYGKLFEEIHVIVFNKRDTNIRMHVHPVKCCFTTILSKTKLFNRAGDTNNTNETQIGSNVFVYPTNHIFKIFYLWNVYRIAKRIIKINCHCEESATRQSQNSNRLLHFVRNDRKRKLKIKNYRDELVVSSQDPFESGLAGWMLKKIYKIPLQIQIHTDFLSPYFWKESFINKLRVILAKFLIFHADGIRVVSERIKKSLVVGCRSLVVDRIVVLPIFVDTQSIKNTPINVNLHSKYPQYDSIILMASRLTKEKNIGLAIEAMAELAKKYPKLGLVIVGSGSELESCKLSVVGYGLENNVKFEPAVDHDTLFSYYKTADLFLLTSNYEGYGRSVIEAMTAGLPVVMTDVGLAREIVINGENGVVVPVGDTKAIVDSIGSLIDDRGKRDRFSNNARKTIESLSNRSDYLESYKKSFDF